MKRLILRNFGKQQQNKCRRPSGDVRQNTGGYYGSHGGDGRRKYHLWLQYTY
mgnify:CR=1 FL=1